MAVKIFVTDAQVEAAQMIVDRDRAAGRKTRAAIRKIAQASRRIAPARPGAARARPARTGRPGAAGRPDEHR